MVKVDLDHVYKKYEGNDKDSVSDFNLHIDNHEFIVFVGILLWFFRTMPCIHI